MFKMIKKMFSTKVMEIELKYKLYSFINQFLNNQNEYINFYKKIYETLKDVPQDKLYEQLIISVAEIVHESNNKGKE